MVSEIPGRSLVAFLASFALVALIAALAGCGQPTAVIPSAQASVPAERDMAPAAARKYRPTIVREARVVWGLDAPIAALAAQLHAESGWNEQALSGVGAAGLAQFMPATAAEMTRQFPELGPPNPYSSDWAIRAQARYMKLLWERTTGAADACHRYAFAAASYNAGPGWVDRDRALAATLNRDGTRWFGHAEEASRRNKLAWQETRGYVRRILLDYQPRYYASWGRLVCEERFA